MNTKKSASRRFIARISSTVVLISLLFVLAACSYGWGSFRRVSLDKPVTNMQVVGKSRVSGSACRIFLRPRHVADAARSALQDAPGAKGLKDVRITARLFGLFNCLVVEGTPVK